VRVVAVDGSGVRREREVGELQIKGASVSAAYVHGGDPVQSATQDDWLSTGDLGYLADGEVVICGRLKELIIVAGRNLVPYDVERVASAVPGVRKGRVAAFRGPDHGGTDTLVVAVETRSDDTPALRSDVTRAVVSKVGVRPRDVLVLPPGSLPKTTSGKMRRSEVRRRYLAGEWVGAGT
jgi:fatty-acyl-CoA synthase